MITREQVLDAIRPVQDPEIGLGVLDLGLIYDVNVVAQRDIEVTMTLTTPGCSYGPILIGNVEQALKGLPGVGTVKVELVWDPPWSPEEMASDYAKDVLGLW